MYLLLAAFGACAWPGVQIEARPDTREKKKTNYVCMHYKRHKNAEMNKAQALTRKTKHVNVDHRKQINTTGGDPRSIEFLARSLAGW